MEKQKCTHPKIASWLDILTQAHCYQCMGCGHEIDIPQESLPHECDIIGLAFGPAWRDKMALQMERRWTDRLPKKSGT